MTWSKGHITLVMTWNKLQSILVMAWKKRTHYIIHDLTWNKEHVM